MDNGQRLETYAVAGERNSGVICLNGAAARLVQSEIRSSWPMLMQPEEVRTFRPSVVFVDSRNRVVRMAD